MSLAARVAQEMDSPLGKLVGYNVRFESKISPSGDTRIIYQTDGMLLRTMQTDPLLSDYSHIILDEAHERSMDTDILLALLKDVCRLRPEFRLIIASATLNSAKFSHYLDDCPIFSIPGRTFAIQKLHSANPEADYLRAAVSTVFQIHISQPISEGNDILVFLPGQAEIEAAQENIEETTKKLGNRVKPLIVAPIYSTLPSELQQKIFEPHVPGTRKVVIGTNICETSLTIDGIRYVIDSGLAKENTFNAQSGTSSLQVTPISKMSAQQRAGRAGRTSEGIAMRLYTSHCYYNELDEETIPEILRSDFTPTALRLKCMGVDNLIDFDFLDAPSPETLIRSLEDLYAIGALDSNGQVTRMGRRLVEIPTHPRLGAALLSADARGCVQEVLTIIAMLDEAAGLFLRPKENKVHADSARQKFTYKGGDGGGNGDHMTLLNVYNEWAENGYDMTWARSAFVSYRSLQRARLVREQLEALCQRIEVDETSSVGTSDPIPIMKSLLSGFFRNVGHLQRDGHTYRVAGNATAKIHPSSCLAGQDQMYRPKVIMYGEIIITGADWMRSCSEIRSEWLAEVAPHFWKKEVEKLKEKRK
jgi:pre-mRNA-splicing factor ATP-dependent RNA helicase DHX16